MSALPTVGTVIAGRYRITRRLGEGASAIVYEATQAPLGRAVALKVLRPELALDARARERFAREARIAATLRHRGAVEIHDFGADDAYVFLAMERLEGETLRALLAREPLGLAIERATGLAAELGEVLVVAHGAGIVHRDLKPENVFIDGERVVVVDFGLAFVRGRADLDRMTAHGVIAGTPAYCAPEQARGADVTTAADIYALGVLLFEMLTGAPPFKGDVAELLSRHLYAPPPKLVRDRPGEVIPTSLDVLVSSMLAKNPAGRPTAAEFVTRLAELGLADRASPTSRAGRMVDAGVQGDSDPVTAEVAIVGELDADLWVALGASGLSAFRATDLKAAKGAPAAFVRGATVEGLAPWLAAGIATVTDCALDDAKRLLELVEAGVDGVIFLPLDGPRLAARIADAIRSRRRRAGPRGD